MMNKLSEAGSLDFSPQNKTLYLNFAASVSGIIFAVVLWIVRPLNCADGKELGYDASQVVKF